MDILLKASYMGGKFKLMMATCQLLCRDSILQKSSSVLKCNAGVPDGRAYH